MTSISKISEDSVFVVSGGARGITAQCMIAMAKRYRCMFMLLGRSSTWPTEPDWAQGSNDISELKQRVAEHLKAQGEQPLPIYVQRMVDTLISSREIQATLDAIRAAGGRAEYHSIDITDRTAMHETLAPKLHWLEPITGIIHGAGVLSDKLIDRKTIKDFEQVYSPKIDGLQNLLESIAPEQLQYIILFSSIAAMYGNVGQVDYALANATLDKAAHELAFRYPRCRVITINWGPWDSGMVSMDLKELFDEHDFKVISSALGAQAFVDELEAEDDMTQVLIGNPVNTTTQRLDPILRMIRARRSMMGMRYDQLSSGLHTYQVSRALSIEENPFLYDHRIHGHAVLPATCALAWMVNICEQLYPGFIFTHCEEFEVLAGIVFDEHLAERYMLSLRELSKMADPDAIVFECLISSASDRRQRNHYHALITITRQLPDSPIYADFDRDDANGFPIASAYADGTLFHGPSFQGAEYVLNSGEHKLTMRCNLAPLDLERQGQFPVQSFNPYVADACAHGALLWMRNTTKKTVLPLSIARVDQFRALEFGVPYYASIDIIASSPSRLVSNLIVHDERGVIYLRLQDVEGVVLPPNGAAVARHH